MTYSLHQLRVIEEAKALWAKVEALEKFLEGALYPTLPAAEKQYLLTQAIAMCDYYDALSGRIALWATP